MQNTLAFLDAVKARHSVTSDYALAKILGVTQQTVSRYRVGKDFLGDSTARKVAELLEMEPAIVVAAVHRERAKTAEDRAVWETILEKLGGVAASVLIGVSALSSPAPAQAGSMTSGIQHNVLNSYTLSARRKRKTSAFSLLFPHLKFRP